MPHHRILKRFPQKIPEPALHSKPFAAGREAGKKYKKNVFFPLYANSPPRPAVVYCAVRGKSVSIDKGAGLGPAGKRRLRGFRQQLLFYTLLMVLFIMTAGLALFSAMFAMFERVHGQTNVYIVINALAADLMESRAVFDALSRHQGGATDQTVRSHAAIEQRLRMNLEELAAPYREGQEQYFLYQGIGNGLTYIARIRDELARKSSYTQDDYISYYSAMNVYNYLLDYVCNRYLSATIAANAETLTQIQLQARRLRFWGLGVIAVVVLASFFAIRRVTRVLFRPVSEMVRTAGEITRGNLDTPDIELSGPDELIFLERSMNQMKTSLREWMQAISRNAELEKELHQRELEKTLAKRELDQARFRLLQAQINPHFLFNTLNTISRTALFEQADTTVDLIEKLAQVFRYTLEYRDDVCLGEELQFVGRYLAIQNARFGERVRFSVFCPEELLAMRIPPLIIQPFVENAIIHGLEPLEEGGEVCVRVFRRKELEGGARDERAVITVADTGVGINGNGAKASSSRDSGEKHPGGHIGMKNVEERISLYYGGRARVASGSGPGGKGTLVRISLPSGGKTPEKTDPAGMDGTG
jgi:sensor histidine kinase YesM